MWTTGGTGTGVYIWASGDTYVGEWVEGRMEGRGSKWMSSGDHFVGWWVRDKAEGVGRKVFASGDVHAGGYRGDLREGWGVYEWVNGDRFEGWWVRGAQEGVGSYYFANGDCYKGGWEGGRKQGRGVYSNLRQRQSYAERWEKGVRKERVACTFYPPRLLRTDPNEPCRSPSPFSPFDPAADDAAPAQLKPEGGGEGEASPSSSASPLPTFLSASTDASPSLLRSSSPSSSFPSSPSSELSLSLPSAVAPLTAVDDGVCKVCYDRPINCVLLRCGHYAVCMQCSALMEHCPFCRQHITEVIQVYRA